jgi:hypothetical protein
MAAEEFTHTGNDVSLRVRSQFGDTSGAQLGDPALLSWINDGQREIVNSNPILRDVKYTDLIVNQSDYTFPNDKVLVIEAIYVNGYPLKNLTPQAARDFILSADPEKMLKAERPEIWYERAGVISVYPVPNKTFVNGIKVEFIKNPTSIITLSDILGIPDRYFNELVNYVISQALEMDENYDAANYKFRQFRDGLDRLFTKDTQSQDSLYGGVLADPGDIY